MTLPEVDNFVDGAAVARVGDLNFAVLGRFAPGDVILAPEDRICATIVEMLNVEGMVLEPAGALAIDALRDLGRSPAAPSSRWSPAATSTSSGCRTSRSGRCAGRAARSTTSCACRSAPARCASS